MMRYNNHILFFIFTLLFFAGCESKPERNIILITADTLRADHLGCYGYTRKTSPNIDQLASKSLMFTYVSSVINNTNPSHISIFTARYPKNHEVYTNWTPLKIEGPITLAQILQDQGYTNAAFVSANHLNSDAVGLGRGFDFYQNTQKPKVNAYETIGHVVSWLKENSGKKFFMWVHLFDPHMPYNPMPPYDSIFDPEYKGWGKIFFDVYNRKISAREYVYSPELNPSQVDVLARVALGTFSIQDIFFNKIGLKERDAEYVKALYDGEIAYMDQELGRLFSEIEKLGLDKNTIIIFTADHGESLGEHGIFFEHKGLYENSLRVPLIVHVPGMGSKKISGMASNLDIMPTVLDLLHIHVSSKIKKGFDGKSLLPLIEGSTAQIRNELYMEHANNVAKSIRRESFKYIFPVLENLPYFPNEYTHQEELYDLKTDPAEAANLINKTESLGKTPYKVLRESLLQWTGKPKSTKQESLDFQNQEKEKMEKLKSLGYIQ